MNSVAFDSISSLWQIFLLFTIPIGGGIPAGVILGKNQNVGWLILTTLYFISDVALAIVFEPVMLLFIRLTKNSLFVKTFRENLKKNTEKILARYNKKPSVLSLIIIAFSVDPMTGRTAAMMAGHHFVSGWAIAIAGDMLFFFLIMGSTLWLNSILGDGTMAAVIIMAFIFVGPIFIRHIKKKLINK